MPYWIWNDGFSLGMRSTKLIARAYEKEIGNAVDSISNILQKIIKQIIL